ncbi:hypothetical protein [Urbifossiella limnaea]|uniref:Uncharacterized protein n=1 Tax=Urbifossiella limnaea TaxID=2528023 RepID=A0A517XMS9_9BACT|nr:hypothetical protein [Urbifossiella limnaea]QDU18786.1 hypothetical protein ETAA1_06820 [Urbifossiella limnaea]
MPWEVAIVNYAGSPPASYHAPGRPDPQPLGARDDVIAAIRQAVPEFQWGMVGGFPPEILAKFSPEVAAILSKQKLNARYDTDDLYLLLYGFEQEPIGYLHAEVRGTGNPVPLLARVCAGRNWSVASDADGSFVDLTAAAAPQWDGFQAYRDRANSDVRDAGG